MRPHGVQSCGKLHHRAVLDQRPAFLLIEASARAGIGAVDRSGDFLRPGRRQCDGKRKQRGGRRASSDTHAASKSPIGASTEGADQCPSTAALSGRARIYRRDRLHLVRIKI
jgi:hypothetical protein